MKKFLLLALLLPASLWAFQKNNSAAPSKSAGSTVSLVCRIYGVPSNLDSMYLYETVGLGKRIIARAARQGADSAYVLTIPASGPKFYRVGSSTVSTATVILGEEKVVTLWGNSQFMEKARTVNSAANKSLEKLQAQLNAMKEENIQLRGQFNISNGSARTAAETRLVNFGKAKTKLLDSLKTANPLLWRYASLQLTPDYLGKGVESEFYAKEYFRNANLSEKAFEDIPAVFDAFEMYTAQLVNMGIPHDKVVEYAEMQLAKIPSGSPTFRMGLGGVISTLKNISSPQYPILANKYINLYKGDNSYGEVPALQMEVLRAGTYLTGYEAPDLVGMTPDSSTYSLKQMRGKIVMIDFWASWCGPCRRENPNVVANYNKYKDKGFDILGVSLDRDMGAWRKAIEADGLPWHHISDLKGWQSNHAALYSVTSIPQTMLLDRDGKIIARNLRGEQLGEKLKEIFGM